MSPKLCCLPGYPTLIVLVLIDSLIWFAFFSLYFHWLFVLPIAIVLATFTIGAIVTRHVVVMRICHVATVVQLVALILVNIIVPSYMGSLFGSEYFEVLDEQDKSNEHFNFQFISDEQKRKNFVHGWGMGFWTAALILVVFLVKLAISVLLKRAVNFEKSQQEKKVSAIPEDLKNAFSN